MLTNEEFENTVLDLQKQYPTEFQDPDLERATTRLRDSSLELANADPAQDSLRGALVLEHMQGTLGFLVALTRILRILKDKAENSGDWGQFVQLRHLIDVEVSERYFFVKRWILKAQQNSIQNKIVKVTNKLERILDAQRKVIDDMKAWVFRMNGIGTWVAVGLNLAFLVAGYRA